MTKTKMTAGELYQLAQAQTLIDLYANGTPTEKELAKHYTKDGKIIPTAEAYEKIDYATDIIRRGSITLMTAREHGWIGSPATCHRHQAVDTTPTE